jgi:type III secretion protein I
MIEAVNAIAMSVSAPAAPAAATGLDVDRFREAFSAATPTSQPTSQPPSSAPGPLAAPAQVKPAVPTTLGDAILSGLKSASADISRNWTETASAVSNPMLTTSDMLRLQVTLIQTSVQYELLGKGISRSTQNLDQILKTQ